MIKCYLCDKEILKDERAMQIKVGNIEGDECDLLNVSINIKAPLSFNIKISGGYQPSAGVIC